MRSQYVRPSYRWPPTLRRDYRTRPTTLAVVVLIAVTDCYFDLLFPARRIAINFNSNRRPASDLEMVLKPSSTRPIFVSVVERQRTMNSAKSRSRQLAR